MQTSILTADGDHVNEDHAAADRYPPPAIASISECLRGTIWSATLPRWKPLPRLRVIAESVRFKQRANSFKRLGAAFDFGIIEVKVFQGVEDHAPYDQPSEPLM